MFKRCNDRGMQSARRCMWAAVALLGLSLFGAPHARAAAPTIGISFSGASDYSGELMFADAMKESRQWTDTNGTYTTITLDSNGWPQQDAEIVVFQAPNVMSGTYGL